jgi:hypothetical protein
MRAFGTALAVALPALALHGSAWSQAVSFPNFPNSFDLVLNGDAAVTGGVLRVAPDTNTQSGSAWYDTRVRVVDGFEMRCDFRISSADPTLADGLAFVIHNDPIGALVLGDPGPGMGYGSTSFPLGNAISNGIAIELDIWDNGAFTGDPDANHISVQTGGSGVLNPHHDYALGLATAGVALADGTVHSLLVAYSSGILEVAVDNIVYITVPYTFEDGGQYMNGVSAAGLDLPDGVAYMGFTASTGGLSGDHDILNWSFRKFGGIEIECNPNAIHSGGTRAKLDTSSFHYAFGSGLHLNATDGPVGEFGSVLVSYDGSQVIPVFGGVLCLGNPQGRYNPQAATNQGLPTLNSLGQFDGSGVYQSITGNGTSAGGAGFDVPLELPFSPAGQVVLPGDTLYFQVWFRDTLVTPGDSANFTNMLKATFP